MRAIASLVLAAAAGVGLSQPGAAIAQDDFPNRPVTIISAFPPGGTVDLLARTLGQRLMEKWKQTVIVENRPGASGIVGSQAVARAAPDGYTLMVVPMTHVTNSSLLPNVPYDPLKDFTPISLLATQPLMLVVNPSFPAKSVSELVARAKSQPGKYNCGSGGNGTSQHLACELFKSTAKVDLRHVPYRGNALAMTDVIGGQIELMFDQMATAVPHVKGGKVRALAVSTAQRSPAMPEVPTVAEAGVPGYEATAWFGVVGPPGMPPALAEGISEAFRQAMRLPDVRESLGAQGLVLVGSTPADFGGYLREEFDKWAVVIKQAGIQAN